VLTDAAVNGSVDRLNGLKENVIIGRLIPARLDQTPEGRERLGVKEGERKAGRLTGFTQAPATFEEALAVIGGGDLVGVDAETGAPAGGDAAAAAAAVVATSDTAKDDGGLLAAVSALTDAAKASDDSPKAGDDDAARAAEALRASTSTAEENVEPAPQFVDDGSEGDGEGESSKE
jgi:hypothetical protein